MSSIAKFLNTARIKTTLDAVIDNTHAFLVDPDKEEYMRREGKKPDSKIIGQYAIFDEYCPIQMSDDFRLLEYLLERNMAIASMIANGQEIPQTKAGKLIKVEGKMGKIAISHVFDEDDEIRMMELSQMQSMPRAFVDMLFGTVDGLQARVVKTANVLASQVWYQGFCDYTDPRSSSRFRLTYNTYPELFPAPLVGTAAWTDYVNANAVRDLQIHSDAYYRINGFYPDETLLSKSLYRHISSQQSTRDTALSLGIITNVPGTGVTATVDKTVINRIFERLDIPPMRIWDAEYEIEVSPGVNTRARYLPEGYYAFLTKGGDKRLMGPTIEAKGKPGIFVKAEEDIKTSPPQSRSYAVGRVIPFFPQPKTLAARKAA